jgi:hypothetical protein
LLPTWAVAALLANVGCAGAQTLEQRIARVDGRAQFVFESRPEVCGDGRTFMSHVLGERHNVTFADNMTTTQLWPACVHGPARVVATVMSGEITRLKVYVGPVPRDSSVVDLGLVPVADARAFLLRIVQRGVERVAREAMPPLVIANGPAPWPELIAVARDDNRPRGVRREAMSWLGQAASARVGGEPETDDDDVRTSIVFALSQQKNGSAVPDLIEIARTNKHAAVRGSALFWLGQSGDPRAIDVMAAILR